MGAVAEESRTYAMEAPMTDSICFPGFLEQESQGQTSQPVLSPIIWSRLGEGLQACS